MARPLLRALFPALGGIRQPLGGEYAARREVLEVLPFVEGWGVELGLLLDVADRFGVDAIAERDLGVREHRNRPLDELAPQALAVLLTGLRRAGVAPVDGTARRVHPDDGAALALRERPPMITVPAYRAKFGRELSA
jgi:glucosyl-3-phosphoglycerate synthase